MSSWARWWGVLGAVLWMAGATPPPAYAAASDPTTIQETDIRALARRYATEGRLGAAEKLVVFLLANQARSARTGDQAAADALLLADIKHRRGETQAALDILERIAALDGRPAQLDALGRMGRLYDQQGRRFKARLTLMRAVALAEQAATPPVSGLVSNLLHLAQIDSLDLRTASARAYLNRADSLLAAQAKTDPLMTARVLYQRGELAFRLTRAQDALNHHSQALALRRAGLGPTDLQTGQSLVALASIQKNLGRYGEAEISYRDGLAAYEAGLGADHPFVATVLTNMGQFYTLQGRYQEAEDALLRGLDIKRQKLGADNPSLAESFNHLGYVYYRIGDFEQAAANLDRAATIWSRRKQSRERYVASAVTWQAAALIPQGELDEARRLLNQSLETWTRTVGPDSPVTVDILSLLGDVAVQAGDFATARDHYQRGADLFEALTGPDHVQVIINRAKQAQATAQIGKWDVALDLARRATAGLRSRIARSQGERAHRLASELTRLRGAVLAHVAILHHLASQPDADQRGLVGESFEVGQLARSTASAQALARKTARFSAGTDARASIIRKRQDLSERWQEIDEYLEAKLLLPRDQRDVATENRLRAETAAIRTALPALDADIARRFPDYAALVSGQTTTLADAQSVLGRDETMLSLLVGESQTFTWSLTGTQASLHRSPWDRSRIEESVEILRESLDPTLAEGELLAVDTQEALDLYRAVFAPGIKAAGSTGHLIVVADGPLQSLPPSVLVTDSGPEPEDPADHAAVPWLIKKQAVSVLPAVASLSALRGTAQLAPTARKAYLGIGDPRLKATAVATAAPRATRGVATIQTALRGQVDRNILSTMSELPETAEELRTVANVFGSAQADLLLGAVATERRLRATDTAAYRTVHFATHGLVAGDFQVLREPALVLTPEDGSAPDDGLLTASEIAQLPFDSDWTVLSACNTAAADGTPGAEGMSGLAKAFFFAGSRRLLISHWEVESASATALTTGIFAARAQNPALDYDAAHRLSILNLMTSAAHPEYAHPLFWAPFVLVGEGNAEGSL